MVVLPAIDGEMSQLAKQVSETFDNAHGNVADDRDTANALLVMKMLVVIMMEETLYLTSSRESSEPNGATSKASPGAEHLEYAHVGDLHRRKLCKSKFIDLEDFGLTMLQ